MKSKIAIIDCGTNTFNLLIAERDMATIKTYFENEVSVRIGSEGINQGIITEDAMTRATSVIESFKEVILQHEVSPQNTFAFATSAFRNARNGGHLKKLIKENTGVEIEIIDGDREADLIFYGASHAVKIEDNALVMDIGGGSVEFIIGNQDGILWKRSFEIGAQRLVELFHHTDPISSSELQALNKYLKSQLMPLRERLNEFTPATLIGAAGTFETLGDIYVAKHRLENSKEGSELSFDIATYKAIHHQLIEKNIDERSLIEGMSSMRVDMIVVASCIIDYLLSEHEFANFHISRYALKEGALFQLFDTINKTN